MPQSNEGHGSNYVVRDAADQDFQNGFPAGFRIIPAYEEFIRFFSGDTSNLLSCIIDRLRQQGDVETLTKELKKFESYMAIVHQCVRSSVEEEKNRIETQNNLLDQPRWQEIPELHDRFLGEFQTQYTQLNTKELPQDLQDFNDWITNWSKELAEEHGELLRKDFVLETWKQLVELTWLCNYSSPTCSLFLPDKTNKIQLVEKQGNRISGELLNVYNPSALKKLVKEKKIDKEYETTALIPSLYYNEDNDNFDCPNSRSRKHVSGVSWSIELVLITEDLIAPRAQPVVELEPTSFLSTQASSAVDEIDLVQTSQQAADESEKPAVPEAVLSGTQPGTALGVEQREDVENLIAPELVTKAQPVVELEPTSDHAAPPASSAVDEVDLMQTTQQAMRFTADESEKSAVPETVLSVTQPGTALEVEQRENVENLIAPELVTRAQPVVELEPTSDHAAFPRTQASSAVDEIDLMQTTQQEMRFTADESEKPAVLGTQSNAALALKQQEENVKRELINPLITMLDTLKEETRCNKILHGLVGKLSEHINTFSNNYGKDNDAECYFECKKKCTDLLKASRYKTALHTEEYNTHNIWNAINEAFRSFFNAIDLAITGNLRLPSMAETTTPGAQWLLGRANFFTRSQPSAIGKQFNEFKDKLDELEQVIIKNDGPSPV